MKTIKVSTWLPLFSGYYGSIWETDNDEQSEVEYINEQREEKGLDPITWNDCEFDYVKHHKELSEAICGEVSQWFIDNGYVKKAKFEKLSSPREYNFANDSIHVEYELNEKNVETIKNFLKGHFPAFTDYVKKRYSSRDGFFSSYSNNASDWLEDECLTHEHKLGAILEFIIKAEDDLREYDVYEHLMGNGYHIQVENYIKLTEV